jgi:hypothetical protein
LLVLEAIASVLFSFGLEFASVTFLRKSSNYAAFREKMPPLFRFLRQNSVNQTEMRGLLHLGVSLLVEDMKRLTMPIAGRMVLAHIHRLPEVVNLAFPGYAESGLLGMIIRRGQNGRHQRT